ncbi:GNAT family N-acetyltransferase [Actinoplanes sp. G11-F43]|uniref:GNAT family N-acetyltransferase n=1 Tax=Actinoplanes sp. G11-F43 TaxID=3424130 RepID=UPI003D33A279
MPEEQFRVVSGPFTHAQISAVARMHVDEVPEGFLTSLGEPVLRMLYRHLACSPHAVLFMAESVATGEPLGYICGSTGTGSLLREFVQQAWPVAVPMVLPRLLRPARILRLMETIAYPSSADPGLPGAEIINFVVVPSLRGRGVATRLYQHLMDWFVHQHVPEVKVVTGERQRRAQGFYEKSGAILHGMTEVHRGTASRIYVQPLAESGPAPITDGYAPEMTSRYETVKRALDITVAAGVLFAATPVAAAVAWAIRREDGGPVLYHGIRVGRYGKPFAMLKFRSMVVDASTLGGPSTADDDPRLTRTGAFLRRWKLDELPQMVNVLTGDMSLVGPRPQVASDVSRYTEDEMRLLDVRPGVTDWASIVFHDEGVILAGHDDVDRAYDELIRPGKIALGLAYVENRGLGTDLWILALTALTLLGYRRTGEMLQRAVPLDLAHVRR